MQLVLLTAHVASVLTTTGAGPFADLTFEETLAKAQQGEKVVSRDFSTTACGPCKQRAQVTWKDAGLAARLEDQHDRVRRVRA